MINCTIIISLSLQSTSLYRCVYVIVRLRAMSRISKIQQRTGASFSDTFYRFFCSMTYLAQSSSLQPDLDIKFKLWKLLRFCSTTDNTRNSAIADGSRSASYHSPSDRIQR